jgi:hypothetical protein
MRQRLKGVGSRTEVPRLMMCIWLHIAAHADRVPRLTLKAGRKEGYKAGKRSSCRFRVFGLRAVAFRRRMKA